MDDALPDAPAAADVKARLAEQVDRRRELLLDVSHRIHAHPETNYEERYAHDLLTQVLEDEGLPVVRRARGLDTAFEALAGFGGPTVAVVCEYDALPGIGHACGHNVIAAAVAEEVGARVVIVGTPAEEGGGGKIRLIDEGAFEGVDAALMVHPAGHDLTRMDTIAVQEVSAAYSGRAAHAAAAPHEGRNALDAAVLGYLNVAALRQHIRPRERVHGVFGDGGDKPNIVPATARTDWMVRAPSIQSLQPLKERVTACLEAGASAAGCDVELAWKSFAYADMLDNQAMLACYRANAAGLGRTVLDPDEDRTVVGSTDMGNVSYLVPSIHPMIAAAPAGTAIHTADFAAHAASPSGDQAIVDGAVAMACTVADLWLGEGVLEAVRAEFAATIERVGPDAVRSAIGRG